MTGAAATATFTIFPENTSLPIPGGYCTLVIGEYDDNSLWLFIFTPITASGFTLSYQQLLSQFRKQPTTIYTTKCPPSGTSSPPWDTSDFWGAIDATDSTKIYDFVEFNPGTYAKDTIVDKTGCAVPFVFQ